MKEEFIPKQKFLLDIKSLQPIMHNERGWEKKGKSDVNEMQIKDFIGANNADEIEKRLQQEKDLIVAEFGSGAGNALSELKGKYPKIKTVGFDFFPETKNPEINQIRADIESLPLKSQTIDIGFSVQTYCYIYDKIRFLNEVFEALKPNGIAYIEMGSSYGYTNPDLREIIKNLKIKDYFEIQEIKDKNNKIQYVVKILKPKDNIKIDWKLNFKGAKDIQDTTSAPIGTIDSYYE